MGQNPIPTLFQFFNVNKSPKTLVSSSGDASGALWNAQRQPTGYAAAYSGTGGRASNQAGVTLSAALATTYVGLCLSNPAASGVNLALGRVNGLCNVAQTALTAFGLISGFAAGGITAHTTPATIRNAIVGNATTALKGLVDTACTLVGTPVWEDWIQEAIATTTNVFFSQDYAGSIIVPPGGYVAIGASQAGPAAGFFGSIAWTENPL